MLSNLLRTVLLGVNIAAVCVGVVVVAAVAPGLFRRLFFGRALDLPPLSAVNAYAIAPDAPTMPRRYTQSTRYKRRTRHKILT
jgi:hypothetical protein